MFELDGERSPAYTISVYAGGLAKTLTTLSVFQVGRPIKYFVCYITTFALGDWCGAPKGSIIGPSFRKRWEAFSCRWGMIFFRRFPGASVSISLKFIKLDKLRVISSSGFNPGIRKLGGRERVWCHTSDWF